jgi:DNA-directed RNA polymerase specialized sigma24 family protein
LGTADDDDLEALVVSVARGDQEAWRRLWSSLEPTVMALLRNPSVLGQLADREDDCRTIVVVVMERLRANDFARLRGYLQTRAQRPGLRFAPWLKVVAKRTAIDCMRAHPDYLDLRRQAGAGPKGHWVVPGSLPPSSQTPGTRPPMTNRATAAALMRHAEATMPENQRGALELWLQSLGHDEIARALELGSPREAERLVRAALERLRRFVREEEA